MSALAKLVPHPPHVTVLSGSCNFMWRAKSPDLAHLVSQCGHAKVWPSPCDARCDCQFHFLVNFLPQCSHSRSCFVFRRLECSRVCVGWGAASSRTGDTAGSAMTGSCGASDGCSDS